MFRLDWAHSRHCVDAAGAGQGNVNFQVSLRIVARPPAPKMSQRVTSNASPGDPPYPMFKDRAMTEEKSGTKLVVITTEY